MDPKTSHVTSGSQPTVSEPGLRTLAFWEIVALIFTPLLGAWAMPALSADSRLMLIAVVVAFLFMFLSRHIHGETAGDIGWRLDNFGKACAMLALPMLAVTIALVAVGWAMGSLRIAAPAESRTMLWLPFVGIAWGSVQQYALQGFINRRAQIVWGKGTVSCLVVAGLFAAFHLPNVWLSVATFAGGLLWAVVYQKYPNLLALGLSHAIMTFVLISTMPESAMHGLRVGFRMLFL